MSKVWLFLFTLAFCSGQLFRFSFFSPDVHFIPLDIFILVFTCFNIRDYKPSAIPKPLLGFLLVGFISLCFSYFRYGLSAFIVGLFYLLRFSAYSLSFIPFKTVFKNINLQKYLLFLGILVAVSGVIQYLIHPDIRSLTILDWDPHYYRVVGTLLDPGFLGIILIIFLINICISKKVNIFYFSICYLPFVFTYSRSSYLAYLAAMLVLAYLKKSWKFAVVTIGLLLITLPLLPRASDGEGVKLERTYSVFARIQNWKNSLDIIKSHPLLGVGFNTYRYAQKESGFLDGPGWLRSHAGAGADSSLLFILATTGAVGFIFYILYLKGSFQISHPYQIVLVSLLVHSFFLNSLFYPFVLVLMSILRLTGE